MKTTCQRCGLTESQLVSKTNFIQVEKRAGSGYQCKEIVSCRKRQDEQIIQMQNKKNERRELVNTEPRHDYHDNEESIQALKKLYMDDRLV